MLDAPFEGRALMLGANNVVVLNSTMPSSVLKKKQKTRFFHHVREAIAAGIIKFSHIPSEDNYADLLIKVLPNATFHQLLKPLLFLNSLVPESTLKKE